MSAAARTKKSRCSRGEEPGITCGRKFKRYRPPGSIPFAQAQGKTMADLYLTAEAELNCITLCFADNTELVVEIEPSLSFTADYSDWKTGDERVIKKWRRIRSM
jgi:hypothetical protein